MLCAWLGLSFKFRSGGKVGFGEEFSNGHVQFEVLVQELVARARLMFWKEAWIPDMDVIST